ncbi:hypothetical protein HMPREF1978_00759 [Actinomyces graevenitzii F0530]|uniref:Uncharacterized protein n=1 Tax=Actinomyces graevenitzii F0530 TaxID=1321817 RepID=U1PLP7_9ACTO|nr:hypothetical protein HMPREF1978_00759 [Actinomyces graevenitzii F0530]
MLTRRNYMTASDYIKGLPYISVAPPQTGRRKASLVFVQLR